MPGYDDRSRQLARQQGQQQLRNDQARRTSAAVQRNRQQFEGFLNRGRQQRDRSRQDRAREQERRFRERQQSFRMRPAAPQRMTARQTPRSQVPDIRSEQLVANEHLPSGHAIPKAERTAVSGRAQRPSISLLSIVLTLTLLSVGLWFTWHAFAARPDGHSLAAELKELSARAEEINDRWDEGGSRLDPGPERNDLFVETRTRLEDLVKATVEVVTQARSEIPAETSAEELAVIDRAAADTVRASQLMIDGLLGPAEETAIRKDGLSDFQESIGRLVAALDAIHSNS